MKMSKNYDERQSLYRYKGFTLGFFIVSILTLVNMFLPEFGIRLFANEQAAGITSIFIASSVAVSYQALKDAYTSRKESLRTSAITTSIITLASGFTFFYSLTSGRADFLNQNGQIENPLIPLTFILWLPISIIIIFKYYRSRK